MSAEWSEGQILRLCELWDAGLSAAKIGDALGISKNAVVGKAHRLKLPPRPSPILRNGPATPRRVVPQVSARNAALVLRVADAAGAVAIPSGYTRGRSPAEAPGALLVSYDQARRPAGPRYPGQVCAWPFGHPKEPGFHFCGAAVEAGRPYCTHHAEIAYVCRAAAEEVA